MKNKFLKIALPMLLLIVATFIIGPACGDNSPPPPPIVEEPIDIVDNNQDPFPEVIDKECVGNYMTNGYFNTTVQSPDIQEDEDIIAATGWRRVWKETPPLKVIGADLFSAGTSPMLISPAPTPTSGNYAGMWVTNKSTDQSQFREAMFNRLHRFIKSEPIPVTYILEFKTAKLNSIAEQVEISIYGINYDDITPAILPLQPTTITTPTNINLFGVANTVLLGSVTIPAGANNTWVNQKITFTPNAKEFPSGGFNYILITRSDIEGKGAAYCGFDDFCLRKK